MDLLKFQADIASRVTGVINLALRYDASPEDVTPGIALPGLVVGHLWIDARRFNRSIFEKILGVWAPEYLSAGDIYRGMFADGLSRFRIVLVNRSFPEKPLRGFHYIQTISDFEGDRIAEVVNRRLHCAGEHLLDAASAKARGDSDGAAFAVSYAQGLIVGALAILAFRSLECADACLPFGPYRRAAEAMTARGATMEAIGTTLDTIESTRLLCSDFRSSASELQAPSAIKLLHSYVKSAPDDRWPSWYGESSVAQYDEVRELPSTVIECMRGVFAMLRAPTCAELGCGTGRIALALSPHIERMYAIDSSAAMLMQLREKDPERGCGRIWPVQASMGATGLSDGCVDIVTEFESFFLFPNPAKLSREIARILSPEGTLIRLVKISGHDTQAESVLRTFDEAIAALSVSGICFVGEGFDPELDMQLELQGFRSRCFKICHTDAEPSIDDLLASRRRRSFPYLEHISERVLQEAFAAACANDNGAKMKIWSDYYLSVGFRGRHHRFERITALLDGLYQTA